MTKSTPLARRLSGLEGFEDPNPQLEQVTTPSGAAAMLLERALRAGDIEGRAVVDLGCGAGLLAVGAALLGATPVIGVDVDPRAVAVARRNAARAGTSAEFVVSDVAVYRGRADTVVMNPPFGAQRAHADRPFLETARALGPRRVYLFALADSRSFIEGWAVQARARVARTEPVHWDLPRTFRHHRRDAVAIPVDLWVLELAGTTDERTAPR